MCAGVCVRAGVCVQVSLVVIHGISGAGMVPWGRERAFHVLMDVKVFVISSEECELTYRHVPIIL